jgi:hypothetical protein
MERRKEIESDHPVNRVDDAVSLAANCYANDPRGLLDALDQHFISIAEMEEVVRLAWVGAKAEGWHFDE